MRSATCRVVRCAASPPWLPNAPAWDAMNPVAKAACHIRKTCVDNVALIKNQTKFSAAAATRSSSASTLALVHHVRAAMSTGARCVTRRALLCVMRAPKCYATAVASSTSRRMITWDDRRCSVASAISPGVVVGACRPTRRTMSAVHACVGSNPNCSQSAQVRKVHPTPMCTSAVRNVRAGSPLELDDPSCAQGVRIHFARMIVLLQPCLCPHAEFSQQVGSANLAVHSSSAVDASRRSHLVLLVELLGGVHNFLFRASKMLPAARQRAADEA